MLCVPVFIFTSSKLNSEKTTTISDLGTCDKQLDGRNDFIFTRRDYKSIRRGWRLIDN